jgi:hypothetical protein
LGSNQQQLKDDFDMKMRAFIRAFKGQAWQAAQPRKASRICSLMGSAPTLEKPAVAPLLSFISTEFESAPELKYPQT